MVCVLYGVCSYVVYVSVCSGCEVWYMCMWCVWECERLA